MFKQYLVIGISAIAIFFLDISLPVGISGGMPYIFLILMGLWLKSPKAFLELASLSSFLIILGFLIASRGADSWINIINHIDATIAVWVTAIVLYQIQKKKNQAFLEMEEKTKVTEALKESEERFRLAFESFPIGNIQINDKALIETFNPAAEIIFGYKAEEVIGKNISIIMPKKIGAHHDSYVQGHLKTGKENIIGYGRELVGRRKNCEEFPLHLGIGKLTIENEKKFIGSITDLSKVKNLETLLRRSQKMEAIGELTGGIAHDFNNLLGIIIGNLDLLKYKIKDETKLGKHADKALSAALRGSELTRRLLNFSRQSSEACSPINPNKIIESMDDFVGKSLTKAISLEMDLAEDLWLAELDPGDLEDSLLNLCLNARDAMPKGGKIIIETKNTILDSNTIQTTEKLKPGEYVEISVSDNGEGMPKELAEIIFDPFFTTKEKDKGTGLGLAMVYSFVQRASGHISVYTEERIGTTFRIYIPRASHEEHPSTSSSEVVETLPRGNECILVVDDEDELAEIAETILENLGYKTLRANGGDEALDIMDTNPSIDLIFSDVVMPGSLGGFDLAEIATIKHPDMKVLLTSGFTGKIHNYASSEKWSKSLLKKPYRDIELAKLVRQILDGEA